MFMTTKTKHLNLSVIFYNKKYLEKKTDLNYIY